MSHSVLIVGNIWPEPRSSAAGLRDWNLIELFRSAGWELTYVSPSKPNEHSAAISALGVPTHTFEANDSAFDAFITKLKPELCIFDRFMMEEMFGWRVREHSPETLRIVDTIDLHFLRRARMRAVVEEEGIPLEKVYAADLELVTDDSLREIASIYRSDLSLILSDFEVDLLVRRFGVPASLLELFRFCYPEPLSPLPGFEERRDFAVIGNFRHPPNYDGVKWLHTEIWPLIRRELPEAELHVYGAYPPKEMMSLDDARTGFRVHGWAEDQFAVLRAARVNLAPLRFGAGIKGKISDGWWCGTPVVTTPIGAEGMTGGRDTDIDTGFGGTVASDAPTIANAAVRLYRERAAWEQASRNSLRLMQKLFEARGNGAQLLARMLELRERAVTNRLANFVGSMLWHHAHKSTTYFSKWIEAKNRGGLVTEAPKPST